MQCFKISSLKRWVSFYFFHKPTIEIINVLLIAKPNTSPATAQFQFPLPIAVTWTKDVTQTLERSCWCLDGHWLSHYQADYGKIYHQNGSYAPRHDDSVLYPTLGFGWINLLFWWIGCRESSGDSMSRDRNGDGSRNENSLAISLGSSQRSNGQC